MEDGIVRFEPFLGQDYRNLALGVLLILVGLAGALFFGLGKKGDRNRRLLASMLLFFLCLIGLVMTVFSGWSVYKIGPVQFGELAVETPYGTLAYSEVQDAHFEKAKAGPGQPAAGRDRLLVITGKSGEVHVLSSLNYPVDSIFRELRTRIGDGR